ncbi:MAG TPA: hypothetical protein VHM90_15975 [Phycisphaerae bacterium]|nr:hypothetical protein [Phycisphaerae bacterium]
MRFPAAVLVLVLAIAGAALAADTAPATAPTPGPKNDAGLTATLIANKDTYVLNPGQSGKAFRDSLDQMKNNRGGRRGMGMGGAGGGSLPAPPQVDMVLRITNTTDKDITIGTGGDDSQINLKLEGPGAVSMENLVAMTMEFRISKQTTLAPGKTLDIKVASLAYGMRGISQHAYWTEPGEYTLTATLTYGTPDGQQDKVSSSPTKVKVEAPKAE